MYARERTLWAKHSTDDLHDFFAWAVGYIDQNSVDFYKNANIRSALLDENRELLPDTSGIDADRGDPTRGLPWSPTELDADDEDDHEDDDDDER